MPPVRGGALACGAFFSNARAHVAQHVQCRMSMEARWEGLHGASGVPRARERDERAQAHDDERASERSRELSA